jgi:hypothetical protein
MCLSHASFKIERKLIAKSVCKLNKCNKVSPPIKHEGRIIIHPSEKCDIFNKYFADISNIEN